MCFKYDSAKIIIMDFLCSNYGDGKNIVKIVSFVNN